MTGVMRAVLLEKFGGADGLVDGTKRRAGVKSTHVFPPLLRTSACTFS